MALTYTAYAPDISTAVPSGDVTSTSRSYTSGDLITVAVSMADNDSTGSLSISNTGTAQSWTLITGPTNTTANCKVAAWRCVMSVTQSMTITVAGNGGGIIDGALYVVAHQGQHATTPIPAGNASNGVGGNDVTVSITPTSAGSCLWFLVSDWTQSNAIAAAANCTKEGGTNQATQQTTGWIRPTTQPRTDVSAFTIGSVSDGTAETEAWLAFEVQADSSTAGELAWIKA
jgi:hypothetical protein